MKKLTSLLASLCVALPCALAKDKAPAPAPEKPLQLAPEPAPTDILIPENIPQTSKPQGSAIPQPMAPASRSNSSSAVAPTRTKPNKTQIAEDEVKQRIQYRLAKNKAVRDPAVQSAWDDAEQAKTDLEKREALKRYYTLLNARIRKIDGSLSKVAIERQTLATRRLDQTRIDPTEPINPDDRSDRQKRE